jgi:ketosteroid isomerase-like protein
MESAEIIQMLWDRIQARDWRAVSDLLDENLVVEWPVSAERIDGRANFVAVNSHYPEGWTIRVLRIVAEGDQVVSEVEVPPETMGVFRVASFWTVRNGKIARGREYWTGLGSDASPEWRAGFVQRI